MCVGGRVGRREGSGGGEGFPSGCCPAAGSQPLHIIRACLYLALQPPLQQVLHLAVHVFSPFVPCSFSLFTHTQTPASHLAAGLDPYDPSTALDAATEIVSFTGSFHGRTMGSLALTYKARGPIVLGKAGRML